MYVAYKSAIMLTEERNVTKNACTAYGNSYAAFHLACIGGHFEVVRLLLQMAVEVGINLIEKDRIVFVIPLIMNSMNSLYLYMLQF